MKTYEELKRTRGKETAIDLLYLDDPAAAIDALNTEGWQIDENRGYTLWDKYLMKTIKLSAIDERAQEKVRELREYNNNPRFRDFDIRIAVYESSRGWIAESLTLDYLDVCYHWVRVEYYLVID
jgi:hypothetical protein